MHTIAKNTREGVRFDVLTKTNGLVESIEASTRPSSLIHPHLLITFVCKKARCNMFISCVLSYDIFGVNVVRKGLVLFRTFYLSLIYRFRFEVIR